MITVEHASRALPEGSGIDEALAAGHAGWDEGALAAAEALAAALGVPVLAGRWSRLWVDLNRSADQPGVVPASTFGHTVPANAALDASERAARIERDWRPFRAEARARMEACLASAGRVVHLSVHTFSPELDPEVRTYALGVLYDPDRGAEAALAERILDGVRAEGLSARANEPYLGTDDGHTTANRRLWPDPAYAGLEIELNQVLLGEAGWDRAVAVLARVAQAVLPRH